MWDIIWVSPQGHRSVSVSRHFLLQAPQCPCSVRKRFSRDHCCRERSKPGCRIVGSHTRWELTTWADFHRLLMSTGCKSSHSGTLSVSRSNGGLRLSGWIGQLSCLTIFSTSLSVAAFLRRARDTTNFSSAVVRHIQFGKKIVLVNWLPSLSEFASAHQISSKSDDFSPRYGNLKTMKMATVRHLGFRN